MTAPKKITTILASRTMGWLWMGGVSLAAGIGALALAVALGPGGAWFYVAQLAVLAAIVTGSLYARSLHSWVPVDSYTDLALRVGWQGLKLLLIADVAWAIYEGVSGQPWGSTVVAALQRLTGIRGVLESPPANVMQLVLFVPWFAPLRRVWEAVVDARRFERQLAPAKERAMAAGVEEARRRIGRGDRQGASQALQQVQRQLSSLAGHADDAHILHHREVLQAQLRVLAAEIGAAPPATAPRERTRVTAPERQPVELSAVDETPAADAPAPAPEDAQGSEPYVEFVESLRESSNVAWDDVAGLDEALEEIKTSFAMGLAAQPDGVTLEAPTRILLHGPPGTGKTLLTAAISHGFDIPFFNIKVSDVLSKYYGESAKLLSAVFDVARQHQPAIVFFDEIEAICASRDGGMEGEERRMVSTLLAELDGLKAKGQRRQLFVIAATNLPWQLDPAVLSRFERSFHIPLPGGEARRRILKLCLADRGHQTEVAEERLVQFSRGYSGREIAQLCQEAIRQMMSAANPDMGQLVAQGARALAAYKMKTQPITTAQFNSAFGKVRPKTDLAAIQRYERWSAGETEPAPDGRTP